MQLEIWHNPRCSKSRAGLALIEEAGAKHVVRRYLDDPPSAEDLDRVLQRLGMEPLELARLGERIAHELGLRTRDLSRAEWLEVMTEHPILIERPIVLRSDGRAILGRPPEKIAELLEGVGGR